MEPLGTIVAAAVTGILAIIGTFIATRVGKKGDRENNFIDQLQEEREALQAAAREAKEEHRAESNALKAEFEKFKESVAAEVGELKKELAKSRAREILLVDYAMALREWIFSRKEPPPPDWPKELR